MTNFPLSLRTIPILAVFLLPQLVATRVTVASEATVRLNRQSIQKLIEALEREENFRSLKFNYFARRGTPELAGIEGLDLLKNAIDKEPVGSHRWFLLKSLYGFGALRLQPSTINDGVQAYNDAFSVVLETPRHENHEDVVNSARLMVRDFVDYLPTAPMSSANSGDVTKVLSKAFLVWTVTGGAPESGNYKWRLTPNWRGAIERLGSREILQVGEAELAKPENASNILLLLSLADLYRGQQPEKATSLLGRAGQLLGNFKENDAGELQQYLLSMRLDSLTRTQKWPEAMVVQRELTAKTGQGFSNLVSLALHTGQTPDEVASITRELSARYLRGGSTEDELLWTASILLNNGPDAKLKAAFADVAEDLVRTFLLGTQKRTPHSELSARTLLIRALIDPQRLSAARVAEAKQWLQLSPQLRESPDPRLQSALRKMKDLESEVQKAQESFAVQKP